FSLFLLTPCRRLPRASLFPYTTLFRSPRLVPPRDLCTGQGGDELGKGLVQPQVVPPAHRHQVPEPHVRQLVQDGQVAALVGRPVDRKSTRLNSSHVSISYAVFCLKKKT